MDFDLTAVLTTWPVPAAVASVAILAIFYRPLARLVDRIRHVRAIGASLDAGGQTAPTPPGASSALLQAAGNQADGKDARTNADAVLGSLPRNEFIAQREGAIADLLTKNGVPAGDHEQRARVLLAVCAFAGVTVELERVYSTIFGSQIRLLEALNVQEPLPREQLKPFYTEGAAQHPEFFKKYSFDQYLTYMTATGLIEIKDQTATITLKGRTLLTFLIQEKKPPRTG